LGILVDTHVFIWALSSPQRLSSARRIELESRTNSAYLSSVSVSEIMFKASLDKLRFDQNPITCAERLGFELLDFSAADAVLMKALPFHHRDPFDRMLSAQSLARKAKLISGDRRFHSYDCDLI